MNSGKDHGKHKAPYQKYFLKNNQDNDLINSEDDSIYFDENNSNKNLAEPNDLKANKNTKNLLEKSDLKEKQ